MKEWENAELEELCIAETQYGGIPSMNFDNRWNDEEGALHVSFAAES